MLILVFKTSLNNSEEVRMISSMLNGHSEVLNWSVDLDDREKVLRIEVRDRSLEHEIVESIRNMGFECEDLDT